MQQKLPPVMIVVAVVFSLVIAGAIGYFLTRPSQDTVSKENAPAYARELMNKSQGDTPTNYGHNYGQGRSAYGSSGQSAGPSSR